MAELVFNLGDITLTSTWTVNIYELGYGTERVVTDLKGESALRTIHITGIPEGENVKRAMLTATFNRVGATDYGEQIKVNTLNFGKGSKKINASEFANGTDWTAQFYYCASGNAGEGSLDEYVDYSCTLYISNIVLTITTGTGSSFDGQIGSLPEGSKIIIDEADGVQGVYSIVHHGYNEGLCLLWRDNCVATTSAFNQNEDTFLADNYGKLDAYLNSTFYNTLPEETKPYIVPAIYPTLDKRLYGTITNIERYVCTPSVREIKETTGAEEWHGVPFDYLDTVACNEIYWTRSVDTSSAGYAYRISDTGESYTYGRDYASGVRPCFCVLETQLVVLSDDDTHYILASVLDAPTKVMLDGIETDKIEQQRNLSLELSWSTVLSDFITGYEVWMCNVADGTYEYIGSTTIGEDGIIPTSLIVHSGDKGFAEYYYKVKAITTPETDYLDSSLSDVYRLIATKRTNIHYYDGVRWLLASIKYYNGSNWEDTNGVKYYDGTQWISPN